MRGDLLKSADGSQCIIRDLPEVPPPPEPEVKVKIMNGGIPKHKTAYTHRPLLFKSSRQQNYQSPIPLTSNIAAYNQLNIPDIMEGGSLHPQREYENHLNPRSQNVRNRYSPLKQHSKTGNQVDTNEKTERTHLEANRKGDFLDPSSDKYTKTTLLRYFSCCWKIGYLCVLIAIVILIIVLEVYV